MQKELILNWLSQFKICMYLDSSNYVNPNSKYKQIIAAGCKKEFYFNGNWAQLDMFLQEAQLNNEHVFSSITYDTKNYIENLQSHNPDHIDFPTAYFFIPEHLILVQTNQNINVFSHKNIIDEINTITPINSKNNPVVLLSREKKENYLANVNSIKKHIIDGDVYELNYCVEFYNSNSEINPISVFNKLNTISPAPFSAYFRLNQRHLICASPERFIMKEGNRLISQPIKGTIARGDDEASDEIQKQLLLNSEKERAENLMIVDLVRNDIARCSITGSVSVDELFGIYSFRQVHQMISAISGTVKEDLTFSEIIKNVFPMGSMTGAPKIMAMQLAEKYEITKRGLYSGCIGYIEPNGNFDFNVVIRSIQHNEENKYTNCMVGSAITFDSDPETEYNECLLKAKALFNALL